jgi:hypothetical protein
MSNFTYIPFTSRDFKGESVLSSFALKETPFTFIPDLSNVGSTQRVLWTFGDGSTSTAITAVKYYEQPGEYVVNLIVYDCFSKAQISTSSQKYHIKDYIDDTFTVNVDNNVWKNGKMSDPIVFQRFIPVNKDPSNIYFRVDGSDSVNFSLIKDRQFSHLAKSYHFSEKIFNYKILCDQYLPVDSIIFDNYDKIFAKISGNQLIICDETDDGSFLVGLSSSKDSYFKDDSVSGDISISFYSDKSGNFLNKMSVTLSATIIENDDVSKFSISSNGLDGEGCPISSFNIGSIQFYNSWIPFTVKIKDYDNFSVKNFPISGLNLLVKVGNTFINPDLYRVYNISSDDGYFYGGLIFNTLSAVSNNVRLYLQNTVTNDQSTTYTLTGESSPFNIYPKDYIQLEKINEDFDMTETIKGLRFQETLLDDNILFDEFLRSIFGDIDSSPDTLGKRLHEKIANYFQNHYDIDRCEIVSLVSMMDMLGTDKETFESSYLKYPEQIKRLVNLISIKHDKLLGSENKFSENLNPRNYSSKEVFGKNLGNSIDTDTYIISAGIPIVSLERFSNKYEILNTTQPVSATGSINYQLSSYNDDWGWGLILPSEYTYDEIKQFYDFYEYVPGFDDLLVGNTLINDGQYTHDEWIATNGIVDNITSYQLSKNLGIVDIIIDDQPIPISIFPIPSWTDITNYSGWSEAFVFYSI